MGLTSRRAESPIRWAFLVISTFWLTASGCTGGVATGNGCKITSDCDEGSICISGQCKALGGESCEANGLKACSGGDECQSGECMNGCCAPICVTKADCPQGYDCNAGVCAPGSTDGGMGDGKDGGVEPDCSMESDCSDPTPHCSTTGKCVECRSGADCSNIQECKANKCVVKAGMCATNKDCAGTPKPVCDEPSHRCEECLSDSDCPSGATCGGDLKCHGGQAGCTTNADCASNTAAPYCNTATKACVRCTTTSHCPMDETCQNFACIPKSTATTCTKGSDCASSEVCEVDYNATNTGFSLTCQPATIGGWRGGDSCQQNSDCRSGYCLIFGYAPTDGICINACTPGSVSTDCTGGAVCPASGIALYLPGPNGQYESTSTGSDDLWAAAPICWPQRCASDDECWSWGADFTRDRTCTPWVDATDPGDSSKVSQYCMPRDGFLDGGDYCTDHSDCGSGWCISWAGGLSSCFGACRTDLDCWGFSTCETLQGVTDNGQPVHTCVPN